jgi:hypothetical protein
MKSRRNPNPEKNGRHTLLLIIAIITDDDNQDTEVDACARWPDGLNESEIGKQRESDTNHATSMRRMCLDCMDGIGSRRAACNPCDCERGSKGTY